MNNSTYYSFRRTDNINLLPLAYFLPAEIFLACPTLCKIPRCFGEVAKSESIINLIKSDQFFVETADSVAAMTFPHFGFRGWKEHYTGDFPVWKLSYSLHLWSKLLEEETGWGLQMLFATPSTESIPFIDAAFATEIMCRVVHRAIVEQGWQPILDVIKEMPCDEDFERVRSRVRIDFLRKWYHTRAEKVKTVSLEQCLEDSRHDIFVVEGENAHFVTDIISDDYIERFKERLSERDLNILELRVEGHIYEEIAQIIGYKNHSGIIKRIRAIAAEYEDYEDENSHIC